VFGGLDPTDQRSTWRFEVGAWTDLATHAAPTGRYDPTSTYGVAGDYLSLEGGGDCNWGRAVSDATWTSAPD
jgi:hypothetical protein